MPLECDGLFCDHARRLDTRSISFYSSPSSASLSCGPFFSASCSAARLFGGFIASRRWLRHIGNAPASCATATSSAIRSICRRTPSTTLSMSRHIPCRAYTFISTINSISTVDAETTASSLSLLPIAAPCFCCSTPRSLRSQ
jgi:hypothetical protein